MTFILCWGYNLGMPERSPEVRGNRPSQGEPARGLQDAGSQESARSQNHIEEFLAGQGRGTPRYKVAGDQVALYDAKARSIDGESWYDLTREDGRADVRIINQLRRRAKNEADGADYEEAELEFETEVTPKYLDDVRQSREDEKQLAEKMRRDWAIAKGKVNARHR